MDCTHFILYFFPQRLNFRRQFLYRLDVFGKLASFLEAKFQESRIQIYAMHLEGLNSATDTAGFCICTR